LNALLPLFINNLLPIFLMAGTGYIIGKTMNVDPKPLSRTLFYIFSPCLIFDLITANQLGNGVMLKMAAFTAVQSFAVLLAAWLLARLFKVSRSMMIAILIMAFLPNAGNYGLAANEFAFGQEALAFASLFFVAMGILGNTVGVYIASLGRANWWQALIGLLKVPMVYAVIFGLLFTQFNWEVPLVISRVTNTLGAASIPGMLVLLGILLQKIDFRSQLKGLAIVTTARLGISPLLGLVFAPLFGLTGSAYQAGVMQASMPIAVMTTVLASEFDVEPEFVTSAVFVTTLLSPLTLQPLMFYLGASP
jgi:predicted permease